MKRSFLRGIGAYDSPVFERLAKIFSLVILNFVWVIASLPVVTMGSASAALYHTVVKNVRRERGNMLRCFAASFKRELLRGCALTLILACILAFLFVDYYCYPFFGEGTLMGVLYLLCVIGLAAFAALALPYVFPLLSRFELSTAQCLRYSLLMSVKYLHFSLILATLTIGCVYAIVLVPYLLFVLPAPLCLVSSLMLERVFKKQLVPRQENGPAEWYEE